MPRNASRRGERGASWGAVAARPDAAGGASRAKSAKASIAHSITAPLARKIHSYPSAPSIADESGNPTMAATAIIAPLAPIALACSDRARSPSMANAPGVSAPAANPCASRKASSAGGDSTNPYANSAPAVSAMPTTTTRRLLSESKSSPAARLPNMLDAE